MLPYLKINAARHILAQLARSTLLCWCVLGLSSTQAISLSGPKILSTTGAPLNIEIELTQIAPEESVDLEATLADEQSYKAHGINMNTGLEDAKVELLTRPDNSKYLKLKGTHPVSDPYVEVLINLKWASGSIIRDFGLLLGTESTNAEEKNVLPPTLAEPKTIKVKAGDTAGRIALQNMDKSQLSLDQMLLALLNNNPDAFIQKNVNLVKAGAELKIPSTDEAAALDRGKAHQGVQLQAKAFANYKATLAAKLPLSEQPKEQSPASGVVSAVVKNQTPAPKDQLKLSPPEPKADTREQPVEEKIAQQKQTESNADRRQDLLQNIEDLSKLAASAGIDLKSGLLSGLPELAQINSLDALSAWIKANFELVFISSFILGCILLLWVWIRINKSPTSTQHNDDEHSSVGLNAEHLDSRFDSVPPTLDPIDEEINSSPVFKPLTPSYSEPIHSRSSSIEEETRAHEEVQHLDTSDHLRQTTPSHQGTTPHSPPRVSESESPNAQHPKFDFDLDISPKNESEPFTREPSSPVLKPAQPTHKPLSATAPALGEQEDPFRVRLDLAEELWKLGQKHTGRALAQEVAEQADAQMQELARRWLAEHP
jgi:FimV-like protein